MKLIKFVLLSIMVANCSDNKAELNNRSDFVGEENKSPNPKSKENNVKLTPQSIKVATKDLDVSKGTGSLSLTQILPKPIFLDGQTLEGVFRPIFGNSPRSLNTNAYFVSNPTSFFNAEEKANLGSFSLHDAVHTKLNTKSVNTPTIDYIRSLRSFLTDACTKLVNTEMASIADANMLISARKPTATKISSFMNRMFGVTSTSIQTGATELANIFSSNVGNTDLTSEPGITLSKNNYIMMCVSIGTDIRTFTR